MGQLLVAAAIAASMSGCCTVIGGVAGHASGTSRAEELEANNEPVPEHIVADRTFMGMVVGAAVDALLIYKAMHSLDNLGCLGFDSCADR